MCGSKNAHICGQREARPVMYMARFGPDWTNHGKTQIFTDGKIKRSVGR